MERLHRPKDISQNSEKFPGKIPEIPKINGAKAVEPIKNDRQQERIIRRDGRK